MSRIHYFQRYSQKENVVTNNSLLLLSRLQAEDPSMLQKVLAVLVDDQELEIGARFRQQVRDGGGSIPDGEIRQQSVQVLVETKPSAGYSASQLKAHLKKFDPDVAKKVLLLLSPQAVQISVKSKNIAIRSASFAQLIEACRAAVAGNSDLEEIVADYEEFCVDSRLISNAADRLLVVPVRISLRDNLKHRLYYCPTERTIQPHRYLGLYDNKTVAWIGEVERVAASKKELDAEQWQRVQGAMTDAGKLGYSIEENHRFYLVREFVATDFRKNSPGGLFNRRYFSIREELGLDTGAELPPLAEVAERLKGLHWQ